MDSIPGQTYLTRPLTAVRFNVSDRTVARWMEDEHLGFPAPIRIRGRVFFLLTDLERWERSRAAGSRQAA